MRSLLVMAVVIVAGCTDQVHIWLTHASDPDVRTECELVISNMKSFYAEIIREQADETLIFQKCINISKDHQPATLAELEALMASGIVFDDVPQDSTWTIWVEGFETKDCKKEAATTGAKKTPLMCGKETNQQLSPSAGDVPINISCVAPSYMWPDSRARSFWTDTGLQNCKFK